MSIDNKIIRLVKERNLPKYLEGSDLRVYKNSIKEHLVDKSTLEALLKMIDCAMKDGIELTVVSAYRSIAYQQQIIDNKLAKGITIEDIFKVSAPAGYSEHHTGRAIDFTTCNCEALEEIFELTPAYEWLTQNANSFGFTQSYPRFNNHGFAYEPWHWIFSDE